MKINNGFTLIELLIVVAIVSIVGAIAYPSYDNYIKKAGRADAAVALLDLASKQERFYAQNSTYTTVLTDLNATSASKEGYYVLSVDAATPAELVNGYTLTATADATKTQKNDIHLPGAADKEGDCTVMTLDSTGRKGAPLSRDPLMNKPDIKDCF